MSLRQAFITLGWCLLERKCAYYEPGKGIPDPPPDHEYDEQECRYLKLAKRLGEKPTAHCVGFPRGRPSGRLVREKLRRTGRFTPWPPRVARASTSRKAVRKKLERRPVTRKRIGKRERRRLGFFD